MSIQAGNPPATLVGKGDGLEKGDTLSEVKDSPYDISFLRTDFRNLGIYIPEVGRYYYNTR